MIAHLNRYSFPAARQQRVNQLALSSATLFAAGSVADIAPKFWIQRNLNCVFVFQIQYARAGCGFYYANSRGDGALVVLLTAVPST